MDLISRSFGSDNQAIEPVVDDFQDRHGNRYWVFTTGIYYDPPIWKYVRPK